MSRCVLFLTVVSALCATEMLACATASDQLRQRAAFDFNCPEDHIKIQSLSQTERGVTACGKRATYIYACPTPGTCAWVKN